MTARADRSPECLRVNSHGCEIRVIEELLATETWKPYTCPTCGRSGQYIGTFKCCGVAVRTETEAK